MKLNLKTFALNLAPIIIFILACGQTGNTINKSPNISQTVNTSKYEISENSTSLIVTPANQYKTKETANTASKNIDNIPVLQNLLIKNLGPDNPSNQSFGDLKYDTRFNGSVFNEFGLSRIDGQGNQRYNPTFEFKAPANTVLVSPITGKISYIEWQASANDWEIHIRSNNESDWRIGIDHLLSLDCNRTDIPQNLCDLPLEINGNIIFEGMYVEAGDLIGYIGTWSDYENIGINGRTELTVFKYINGYDGVINYCPVEFLSMEVRDINESIISELMKSFEKWSTDDSIFDEKNMVAPGCLYQTIKEINGNFEISNH